MKQDKKLQQAFKKIKEDIYAVNFKVNHDLEKVYLEMNDIKKTLLDMKELATLNKDIKEQIKVLKDMNVEKFTDEIKKNFGLLTNINEDFTKKFDSFHMQFNDLRSKMEQSGKTSKHNTVDINTMINKIDNTERLINEKIDLEIANIKLEVFSEFGKFKIDLDEKLATLDEVILSNIEKTKKTKSKK